MTERSGTAGSGSARGGSGNGSDQTISAGAKRKRRARKRDRAGLMVARVEMHREWATTCLTRLTRAGAGAYLTDREIDNRAAIDRALQKYLNACFERDFPGTRPSVIRANQLSFGVEGDKHR